MKIELHLHTSRYSACSIVQPEQIIHRLVDAHYDGAFITEHEAVWSDAELEVLRTEFPGFDIFPGIERTLYLDGPTHMLVLGTNDREYLRIERGNDLLDKAKSEGCLTVLAHPFRWEGAADILDSGHLPDALEYYTNNHEGDQAAISAQVAGELNLPLVNAGDTHALMGADKYWIETDRPFEIAKEIRNIVLDGAYSNRSH